MPGLDDEALHREDARYYRCSRREEYGKDQCTRRPLPAAALRDFVKVWVNMSPDNQGRFLRALIEKVVVDEDKGTCRVELIDFGAASGTKEAA